MNPEELRKQYQVLNELLKEHYDSSVGEVYCPERIELREFGFAFFIGQFRRHMSFKHGRDLHSYIQQTLPKDVYYSVASYRRAAAPMADKGWMEAELPFDLDAEQVLRTDNPLVKDGWISNIYYDEIKRELFKLLDNFIEADFGLTSRDYTIAFSGGRGFHVRITDKVFKELGSQLRRQIVEHVALGHMPEWAPAKRGTIAPFTHDYGWDLRTFSWLKNRVAAQRDRSSPTHLPQRIVSQLATASKPTELCVRRTDRRVLEEYLREAMNNLTVAIDERVTVDLNRLLRAAGSVHGGSGLICKILSKTDLDGFEPLTSAVMNLRSSKRLLVENVPLRVEIKGESLGPSDKGKSIEVNSALAYYVVVRRGARFDIKAI